MQAEINSLKDKISNTNKLFRIFEKTKEVQVNF